LSFVDNITLSFKANARLVMTFTETLKTEYVFLVPTVETIISALNHKQEVETLFKSDFVSQQDIQNGIEGYDVQRVQAFATKSFFNNIEAALLKNNLKRIKNITISGELSEIINLKILNDNIQFS
tara:strand:+ start:2522 stop:2896 length:375 start_codon:yes stop_codon:yes gene_type:complete